MGEKFIRQVDVEAHNVEARKLSDLAGLVQIDGYFPFIIFKLMLISLRYTLSNGLFLECNNTAYWVGLAFLQVLYFLLLLSV